MIKKVLLVIFGSICLVLGAVGIVLPVLPTTPFVIVASLCFASSSQKLNDWLLKNKFFSVYVQHYKNKTGVPLRVKVVSLCFLWSMLAVSAALVRIWYVWLILGTVGTAITIHILCIKTKKSNCGKTNIGRSDTQEKGAEMKTTNDCAAVCGLFCGTCPSYIHQECGGCLSEKCCCDCFNGFKECVLAHDAARCYECPEFPCGKLQDFSTKHIVNGIGHHKNVIHDLTEMKEIGVDRWIEKQFAEHTCAKCGKLIPWYQKNCNCK